MSLRGPIILVEDDKDDFELFKNVLKDLNIKHDLIWFENSIDAFNYLLKVDEQPFLIFSDINMHLQNGMEFKTKIDSNEHLRKKAIPFIFIPPPLIETLSKQHTQKWQFRVFFKKPEITMR